MGAYFLFLICIVIVLTFKWARTQRGHHRQWTYEEICQTFEEARESSRKADEKWKEAYERARKEGALAEEKQEPGRE